MRIAVIGGAGQMGNWLVNHFIERGMSVIISDPRKPKDIAIESTTNNQIAVIDADVVLVSVPMELTPKTIQEVVPHMKSDSIICEISTLKAKAIETLLHSDTNHVRPVSLHPLFGPRADELQKRFALVPIRNLEEEKKIAEQLFPDSDFVIVERESHDRMMALTLSLPYFTNMVLASVFHSEDIRLMEQLSGTTFKIQFMLTGSIMSHSSGFQTALQTENEYALELLTDFRRKFENHLELLNQDREEFERTYRTLQSSIGGKVNLDIKYEEMYKFLKIMEGVL
ncbi:MAG: prephenate dehydrogenase/arogenate dehydrogenase family protein [Candidatus Thorarchaeota archaeon]